MAENPKAMAMFFLGLGVRHLIAAFFLRQENPAASALPAFMTFGVAFVGMSAFHRRRSARV
jgi:hypothetical protein